MYIVETGKSFGAVGVTTPLLPKVIAVLSVALVVGLVARFARR